MTVHRMPTSATPCRLTAPSSAVDFDFWSWGMEKYERAVTEFDGPEFSRLIDDAQQPDQPRGSKQ